MKPLTFRKKVKQVHKKEYDKRRYCKNKEDIKAKSQKWREANKEKIRVTQKEWCKNNKKHLIDYTRERKYGLTKEQYNKMYMEQLGLCAVCHEPFGDETPHVDHCHKTKKVRGLVHRKCNTVLGLFNDN